MSVEIIRSGDGVKTLLEKFEKLRNKGVYVGIPAESNSSVDGANDFNMAALAAVLEFGSADGRIPERPFLRQTLQENEKKYANFFAEQLRGGKDIEQIYQMLAMMAQGDVQKNIVNGGWTPNARSTIRRKGSSKPLIDTGRLRQSVIGVVRDD